MINNQSAWNLEFIVPSTTVEINKNYENMLEEALDGIQYRYIWGIVSDNKCCCETVLVEEDYVTDIERWMDL